MPFIESLPYVPQRIVSLVPSQTELLFDLGLGEKVVGVTKFCIHPARAVNGITKVGGTKQFRFDAIDQLRPDLVLGNKEENYREGIERLAAQYPVWMSDIYTLADALSMIRKVGELTGTSAKAASLAELIGNGFAGMAPAPPVRVAYFIWRNPWMVAGNHTFIDALLKHCGLTNVFGHLPRYPAVPEAQLRALQPDFLLLSSEPYPFAEKHREELQQLCPGAKVLLVDGEMFSWYGSRLLQSPAYLTSLLRATTG
ncbi:MAG: ABC transporter substrate-binding protein [Cytophagales bacterium]|nr:ABC transporter substrate-binding protein [Cytophagales bacterium]